ncbi:MAG TPA: hydrogenase maturation protease [Candidatus Elarobacter sp.]|nr:hydrogenase maturation protease [Candidatus Elarobacter sp.]
MILVAGIGNIFFGDDGFGPEVARALLREPPAGAKVEDFGIRGLHLAYELLDGYERAFLIDAVPRGNVPGTLYVIEPSEESPSGPPDAHRMDVQNVFAYLRVLGGEPPPVTIVGCEPATAEPGLGLSPTVADAVAPAAALVRRLIDQGGQPCSVPS